MMPFVQGLCLGPFMVALYASMGTPFIENGHEVYTAPASGYYCVARDVEPAPTHSGRGYPGGYRSGGYGFHGYGHGFEGFHGFHTGHRHGGHHH